MDNQSTPSWPHTIRCVLWISLAIEGVGALLASLPRGITDEPFAIGLYAMRGAIAGLVPGLLLKNMRLCATGAIVGGVADLGFRFAIHVVAPLLLFEWNSRGADNWELNQFLAPTHYGWHKRPNRSLFSYAEVVAISHGLWMAVIGCVCLRSIPGIGRRWRRAMVAVLTGAITGFVFAYLAAWAVPKASWWDTDPGLPDIVATLLAICTVPAGMFAIWMWFPNRLGKTAATGRCQSCDYDLRGSDGTTCPECGAPISRLSEIIKT